MVGLLFGKDIAILKNRVVKDIRVMAAIYIFLGGGVAAAWRTYFGRTRREATTSAEPFPACADIKPVVAKS